MSGHETVRYQIDGSRSRFTVKAFAGGLLSSLAHNPTIAIRDFTGEVAFAPDAIENSSLLMKVNADSLELTDQVSDKDRKEIERMMREEVLETNRYPEIIFESTQISGNKITEGWYRVNVTGNLTLHGITNKCSFDTQVRVNADRLSAQGEFPLRQTDHNIKLVSAAGGTIKVKDELKFSFDIVANKEGG